MKRFCCIFIAAVLFISVFSFQAQAADLGVEAKSALLMDVQTGTVLYEKDAHTPLAPASVTKVMTMLLIMEAIDSGRIGWNDTVTASETAAAKGGSQIYLKAGETMSVSDMLKSIAVSSANDCACAMAEHISGSESAFVDAMNAKAADLGMQDTHFVNCTGLDDTDEAKTNHKTSAYDIAVMSRELLKKHPDIKKFTTIWMDTVRNGTFGLSNTNKLVRFYSGATGLKTGFTSDAGYCLSASAERDGLALIAVVMGCESSQKRFGACKSMLDYGFANYALVQPEIPQNTTVPVRLGTMDTVTAGVADAGALLIDKSQKGMVTTEFSLEPEITAPVSKGKKLGTMTIKAGAQILKQTPLVAEYAVPRLQFGQLFIRMLKRLAMAKV